MKRTSLSKCLTLGCCLGSFTRLKNSLNTPTAWYLIGSGHSYLWKDSSPKNGNGGYLDRPRFPLKKKITARRKGIMQMGIVTRTPVERNPIEGKYGQAKTAYGLDWIKARLMGTSESWIASIILTLNLVKLAWAALPCLISTLAESFSASAQEIFFPIFAYRKWIHCTDNIKTSESNRVMYKIAAWVFQQTLIIKSG